MNIETTGRRIEVEARHSPYQGLVPYDEKDAPFFFGRETERKIIIANLFASPLTLLYSESGVGKSSVLRAGVAHELRRRDDLLIIVFSEWQGTPLADLKGAVTKAVFAKGTFTAQPRPLAYLRPDPFREAASLSEYLNAWSRKLNCSLMIILDQFEEYSLYHPQDDAFAIEFPRAVLQSETPISFLISIREDSLAKLDRFEGHIPTLFDNYLRINHLDLDAGREAIERPIQEYNLQRGHDGDPFSIEPRLVDAVLSQVKTGQVVLGEGGRGVVSNLTGEVEVETPYLQLVMTRIWDEEIKRGSKTLRLETLNDLGGAGRIVRTHLDAVVSALTPEEQEIAAAVFYHLVTPSGTKIAHSVPDLAEFSKIPVKRLRPVLEKLSAKEVLILRALAPPPDKPSLLRYEIYHDVLAAALLEWQKRFTLARELEETKKKIKKKQRRMIGIALLLSVLFVLGVYAYFAWARLRESSAISLSYVMAIHSLKQDNNELAALLASEAVKAKRTDYAEGALRTSLLKIPIVVVLDHAKVEQSAPNKKGINWASLSPDNKSVLTAGADGTAVLWDLKTGKPKELRGHTAAIGTAAFNPQGRFVVTASADGTARIWNIETGENTGTLNHATLSPNNQVMQAVYSSNGRLIATASTDRQPRLWDAESQTLINTFRVDNPGEFKISSVAFSPDGTLLAASSGDGNIRIFDISRNELKSSLKSDVSKVFVFHVSFSPDGKTLIAACGDGTALIWNLGEERIEKVLTTGSSVSSAVYSPDGNYIITAENNGRASLWDVNQQYRQKMELRASRVNVGSYDTELLYAEFSSDSRYIVTASGDGRARVWSTQRIMPPEFETGYGGDAVTSVAVSPDGRYIATGRKDGVVRLWLSIGLQRGTQIELGGQLTSIAFSPDGHYVVTTAWGRPPTVWDVNNPWNEATQPLYSLEGRHKDTVMGAAFSPDGKYIVTASLDKTACLWEAGTGRFVDSFEGDSSLRGVAFNPDGSFVATARGDGKVGIWDLRDRSRSFFLPMHSNPLHKVAFSPNGEYIVTASADKTARVWNVMTRKPVMKLTDHKDEVLSAAFSPDGKQIVTASKDKTIRIWDWGNQELAGRPIILSDHAAPVNAAVFSPDGTCIITASDDNSTYFYTPERFAPVEALQQMVQMRIPRTLTPEEREKFSRWQ